MTDPTLLDALEEAIAGLKYVHSTVSRFNDGQIPKNLRRTIDALESHKHVMAAGPEMVGSMKRIQKAIHEWDEMERRSLETIQLVSRESRAALDAAQPPTPEGKQ